MSAQSQTTTVPAATVPAAELAPAGRMGASGRLRAMAAAVRDRLSPWHAALIAVVAGAAELNLHRLSQNGYANIFYSAGVKSELQSLHNFVFLSFDPGGLITIDKPPLGIWLQVASAKIFGFAPLSLLVPEAVIGILSVLLVYGVVARRFGRGAGVASAAVLATFPSFVAVSRDNGVDPLLLLLMLASAAAALRASEEGRLRWLLASAVLVGLAFNTKTLAALLVVPGIALAYLVCAPGAVWRRILQLALAGVVMVVVCGAWIAYVDLTPASQRPYVGGSTDNSEVNLTFDYNGVGRVGGQEGGPGQVPHLSSALPTPAEVASLKAYVNRTAKRASGDASAARAATALAHAPGAGRRARLRAAAARARAAADRRSLVAGRQRIATLSKAKPAPPVVVTSPSATTDDGVEAIPVHGRAKEPSAFGGPTGPLRLFSTSLGGQDGWMLPFAGLGLIALALTVRGRRDQRLAGLIVFGGWFLVEAAILSFSKGIVHPYYVSALAPGTAVMVGAGAFAMAQLARRVDWRLAAGLALPVLAAFGTLGAQIVLLQREHYLHGFVPYLLGGAGLGIAILLARQRWSAGAMIVVLAALLVAPTAYATTLWQVPTDGTFPAAGPHADAGPGGYGVSHASLVANIDLARWARTHRPGTRWAVLTEASDTASPLILMGLPAGALGGYSGVDPVTNGAGLARLVAAGDARYVLLGGAYADRGGNAATVAVGAACRHVPTVQWRGIPGGPHAVVALFDCAGRERQLAAAPGV